MPASGTISPEQSPCDSRVEVRSGRSDAASHPQTSNHDRRAPQLNRSDSSLSNAESLMDCALPPFRRPTSISRDKAPPPPIDVFGRALPVEPPGCESPIPVSATIKRRWTRTSESIGSGKSAKSPLSGNSIIDSESSTTASRTSAPTSSHNTASTSNTRFIAEHVPVPSRPRSVYTTKEAVRVCTRKRPHSAVSELSISSDSSGANVDVIELSHARVQPIRQALGDLVQLCPRTGNSSKIALYDHERSPASTQLSIEFPAIPSPASNASFGGRLHSPQRVDEFPPSPRQPTLDMPPQDSSSMPGFLSLFVDQIGRTVTFFRH